MVIVLVCSGGVSASIFMKKMKLLAEQKQIHFTLTSCSIHQLKQKADILLLSPQCAYAKKQVLPYVTSMDHILVIDSFAYSALDAQDTLRQIQDIMENGV